MKVFEDYLKESGEIGHIESINQSIIYVSGLPHVRLNEVVMTESNQQGIVTGIDKDLIEIIFLSTEQAVVGSKVTRTAQVLKIKVSEGVLGRILNPLALPIDGLGPITGHLELRSVYNSAPGIVDRVKVSESLNTGVGLVDFMIPLGKGQRELVLGDQKTGKTTFILQTMAQQAKEGTVCIYVGIGKKKSDVKRVEEYLKKMGVFDKCVIVFSSSADPASQVFIAPYSGMTIAEHFRDRGKNVLIVFDDLTNHAKFYREISLLSKRMPARESYPGDIFHIHAALLERAGRVKHRGTSVSISALPLVETVQGDLTGYLPTNTMAMTDGHIFFDASEFKKGKRPGINTSLSVTRVGNQTQKPVEKKMRKTLFEKLNQYKKAQELAHFGFDLPLKTRADLNLGERLEAVFDQESYTIISKDVTLILLGLVLSGFWSSKSIDQVRVERTKIVEAFENGSFRFMNPKLKVVESVPDLEKLIKDNEEKLESILYSKLSNQEKRGKKEEINS